MSDEKRIEELKENIDNLSNEDLEKVAGGRLIRVYCRKCGATFTERLERCPKCGSTKLSEHTDK